MSIIRRRIEAEEEQLDAQQAYNDAVKAHGHGSKEAIATATRLDEANTTLDTLKGQ